MSREKKCNIDESILYCIIPGFLGNYEEGLSKKLYDYLIENNKSVYAIEFYGHRDGEDKIMNLDEMIKHLNSEIQKIRAKHPDTKIIFLAHSQGASVIVRNYNVLDENMEIVFIAPSMYINETVIGRLSDDCKDLINNSNEPVKCKISSRKQKLIDKKWLQSYRNHNPEKYIGKINSNCTIVQATNDYLDKKNIKLLKNEIKNCKLIEIESNHFFDEPESAFGNLVKSVII